MSLKPIEKLDYSLYQNKPLVQISGVVMETTNEILKINELIEVVNEQSEIIKARELILRNIIESLKSFSEIIKISLNYDL